MYLCVSVSVLACVYVRPSQIRILLVRFVHTPTPVLQFCWAPPCECVSVSFIITSLSPLCDLDTRTWANGIPKGWDSNALGLPDSGWGLGAPLPQLVSFFFFLGY